MPRRPSPFPSAALVLSLLVACSAGSGGSATAPGATVGPAVAITARSPQAQTGIAGQLASQAAVVKVSDAAGHGVSGVSVTFAVTVGGGYVTEGIQTTNSSGLATMGRWVLGDLGENTLTASASGLSGSPVTFTATATAPVLTVQGNGLTGYLTSSGEPGTGYQYGVSFYSEVSTLQAQPTQGTQLGHGSWIIPDNRDFDQPLCPVGTYARDHWPERGPSYRDVYQTIEGGVGEWTSEMFPTGIPKFRVNGTANCYSDQISSTGWEFGPKALPSSQLGLAQLSNRLLMPPDGVVFQDGGSDMFVGYGWIALPLIPAYTSPWGVPTGDQSWTLFLNASNFSGPVVFYTPEIWSQVNVSDRTGLGRGEDARPAYNGGAALEIGITPMITHQAKDGTTYARIPRITFAVGASGAAPLLGDIRYYSKQAIWDGVATAVQNGSAPSGFDLSGAFTPALASPGAHLTLGGQPVSPGSRFQAVIIPSSGGGSGDLGMRWGSAMEAGVLPEYFESSGSLWLPVPKDQVPAETFLQEQTFPPAPRQTAQPLDMGTGSPWDSGKWAAGPFSVTLSDGSTVDYVWYKFIDQPAVARLGLTADVLQRLQTFVEAWQAASGTSGITIPPPTSGTLVSVDGALLVTPPAGLETGYVPIVIAQR